jgi:hypothetical protein
VGVCSAMAFNRDPSRPPDRCIAFVRPLVLDVITVVLIRSNIGYVVFGGYGFFSLARVVSPLSLDTSSNYQYVTLTY